MSGNKEGGMKFATNIKQKYGEDYYQVIGSKGGKTIHKTPRGFAAMSPEQRSLAGHKGGSISRRPKVK